MATRSDETLRPVGLCGPSELRVRRFRKEDFNLPDDDTPFDIAAGVSVAERISALRQHIIREVLARFRLIDAVGGRHDIATLICKFLDEGFDGTTLKEGDLRMVKTNNNGACYSSSRSRNVDLFFKSVPKLAPSEQATKKLERLLEDAWQEDQEVCLKLVFHIGAARKGKQDRWNFYDGIMWLWDKSPATVLCNLHRVEPTVYWKALLEILARICEGRHLALERDIVMHQAYAHERPRLLAQDAIAPPVDADAPGWRYTYQDSEYNDLFGMRVACGEAISIPPEEAAGWAVQVVDNGQNDANRKRGNCGWQPRTRLQQAENAVQKYDNDPLYRALHLRIAALFAKQLVADELAMQAGKRSSLAGKWAPLLDKSFDRRTLVAESIARMLYPPHLQDFAGLTEQHYSYRARIRYAALLNALKEYRKEPARLLNAGRCAEIKYKAVPGTCMRLCTPLFLKNDGDRFTRFLEELCAKKKGKLNSGSLQPHELMRTAMVGKAKAADVAELQWKGMVANVKKGSHLRNCIAVCDMSSDMMQEAAMDTPHRAQATYGRFDDPPAFRGPLRCLDIAVSLSLLISEVAEKPFAGKVITFEDSVDVLDLGSVPSTLPNRARALQSKHKKAMEALPRFRSTKKDRFGRPVLGARRKQFLSSHIFKVFELLLKMSNPPERVFVFSTMAFNAVSQSGGNPGISRDERGKKHTAFQAVHEMYQKMGKTMPEIVFWNLSGCQDGVPVVATQHGAILVSGFSAALVKDILTGGSVDPLGLLQQVVSMPLFSLLSIPCSLIEAERLVLEALALEGQDAHNPEVPVVKHSFPAGEEWEMVEPIPVEAEAVEAAAPRRAPLLAVRGVRRVRSGDKDDTEDALLALIGIGGSRIKEARNVLSVATATRLRMKARVWLDVEYVDERLGALAVTVAARAPEAALREHLATLLLPAADALLARVVRDPTVAEERKSAWESGKWLEDKQKRLKKGIGFTDAPKNCWGELPYHDQLAQYSLTRASAALDPNFPFLPEEDVVPALLAGLESEERAAVVAAAEQRKCWPVWPRPRFAYNPPPRTGANRVGASLEEKTFRLKSKALVERKLAYRMNKRDATFVAEVMEIKVTEEMEHEAELRSKHNARGGPHGEPAQSSRRWKSHSPRPQGGKHSHAQDSEEESRRQEKQQTRQDFKKEARKRQQGRARARDDKLDI